LGSGRDRSRDRMCGERRAVRAGQLMRRVDGAKWRRRAGGRVAGGGGAVSRAPGPSRTRSATCPKHATTRVATQPTSQACACPPPRCFREASRCDTRFAETPPPPGSLPF
jgi:hypothetical protein